MKKLFTLFAVATLAFAAQSATLTVADGIQTNAHYPFHGLYCDTEGSISQMIYPAEMLTDMVGMQITEIKFYATAEFAANLEGCVMNFALKIVEENEFPTSEVFELADGDICGTASPVPGETEFVLTLDKPFLYEGGNLLIGTEVIEPSDYKTTYFYGISTGLYGGCYQYTTYYGSTPCYREAFMPKTTFTFEEGTEPGPGPEPTEQTAAPTFNGYTTDGIHAYFVEIVETEPSTIYYKVFVWDEATGDWAVYGAEDWTEYTEILSFAGNGRYRVEAYAVAPGKLPSFDIAYEFVVSPITGIAEMNADKAISSVRYFNAAGQEMSEANGLTIVVTTYTDGTTSTAKVIK